MLLQIIGVLLHFVAEIRIIMYNIGYKTTSNWITRK